MDTDGFDPFVEGLDPPLFVVTTAGPAAEHGFGGRAGCLIGFATQSSIHPPRFLVCLSDQNRTYRVALTARLLAVHLLGAGQTGLAALFGGETGDDIDKFARCAWQPGPDGIPLLTEAPRRFVGDIVDHIDLGDHRGFLLAPRQVSRDRADTPLLLSDLPDLSPGHPA